MGSKPGVEQGLYEWGWHQERFKSRDNKASQLMARGLALGAQGSVLEPRLRREPGTQQLPPPPIAGEWQCRCRHR